MPRHKLEIQAHSPAGLDITTLALALATEVMASGALDVLVSSPELPGPVTIHHTGARSGPGRGAGGAEGVGRAGGTPPGGSPGRRLSSDAGGGGGALLDPGLLTVPQLEVVVSAVGSPAVLERIRVSEEGGRGRITAVRVISRRIDELRAGAEEE